MTAMEPIRAVRPRPLVTLTEAAKKLDVPIGTLYSWSSRGDITAVGIGPHGKRLFYLDEIANIAEGSTRRRRGGAGRA